MLSPTTIPAADWITTHDALQSWLSRVSRKNIIGIDTEFMRHNTFYPQLALLQLSWQEHHALIDPLAFKLKDGLHATIGQNDIITVMHSAGEDLEAMSALLPGGPGNLFDTQIAAAFAGMGSGISYRALVATLIGIDLDKGETRSNWLQRPLSTAQRSYATLDVVHLSALHQQLAECLEHRGYTAWHAEDCTRLKHRACHRDNLQPQHALRSAAAWPQEQQALLRRLLIWRDHCARQLDRPRSWLLEDALAMSLVQRRPSNRHELEQRSCKQRALYAAQRNELFTLLNEPLHEAEIAASTPIPTQPQGLLSKTLAVMKQRVDTLALELDLPASLLCSRKALEEYATTQQWPELLQGWRQTVLQPHLNHFLPD